MNLVGNISEKEILRRNKISETMKRKIKTGEIIVHNLYKTGHPKYPFRNVEHKKNFVGEFIGSDGYVWIYHKEPHLKQQSKGKHYVKRCVLNMEKAIGRKLKKEEVIHHIDEDKSNDNIDNLKLFPNIRLHTSFHMSKIQNEDEVGY